MNETFPFSALALALLMCLGFANSGNAQTGAVNSIPNVYLDCIRCFETYLSSNIDFINYVRDQEDADIYVHITSASTGSGRQYTIAFTGFAPYSTRNETVSYHSLDTDTADERRSGLLRHVMLGLIPFLVESEVFGDLNVAYEPSGESAGGSQVADPWNSWVFDFSLGSSMSVEERESNFGFDGRVSAERVTHQWNIETRARLRPDRRTIELSDGRRRVNRDRADWRAQVIYSIGSHFGVGIFSSLDYSQRRNILYDIQASPAVEYSVFPYSQFQERRIFIQYRLTPSYRKYAETTIYQKNSETIAEHEISGRVRFDRRWGRVDVRVARSNYFHDVSLNRLTFSSSFNIRIARGLAFIISGEYRLINDQISLPAGDLDDIDLLLGQRQQATSYDYNMIFGLSYTFGSMFSSAVNPRL